MTCKACRLDHSPLVNCTVARRLAESAAKKATAQLNETKPKNVKLKAETGVALNKSTERVKAHHQRQVEAGLLEMRIWAHPDHHAAIKDFVRGLKK